MKSLPVLNVRVDDIPFYDTLIKAEDYIKSKKPAHFISLSALTVLDARKDKEFNSIINRAAVVNCDGAGVKLAVKLLHGRSLEKVSGIDLIPFLCRLCAEKGYKVFFLGASKEVISEAAKRMKKRFPKLKVAGYLDGYFKKNNVKYVIDKIKKVKPDVLFVGLGQPSQEKWIDGNLKRLKVPVCIGVGGSFDVISGKLKRAPYVFQRSGFEWAYRLIRQPWRIKRILRLFVFLYLVIIQKLVSRRKKK